MVFGRFFVSGLHVKEGKVRVNELFVRSQLLSLVTFGDGSGIISFAIIGHAKRQLRVKMSRLLSEYFLQPGNRAVVIARAEIIHRVVVLFLVRAHNVFDKANLVQEHKRAQVRRNDA